MPFTRNIKKDSFNDLVADGRRDLVLQDPGGLFRVYMRRENGGFSAARRSFCSGGGIVGVG